MLRFLAIALLAGFATPAQASDTRSESVVAQERQQQQTPVMKRDCESKREEGVS